MCCGTECHVPEKKLKPKPWSSSKIYGESRQHGPKQRSYFGQTAMPPPGETLKSSSTLVAAALWWGEQQQADEAVAGGDAVVLQPGKAGGAGKLRGVDVNLVVFVPKCHFPSKGRLKHPDQSFTQVVLVSTVQASFPPTWRT